MKFETTTSLRLKDAYHTRTEPEAARVLGVFYWSMLILLSAILVAGSIGYGLWEFIQPNGGGPAPSTVVVPSKKVFSKTSVQKILQSLDEKGQEYERRKKEAIPVKDPS